MKRIRGERFFKPDRTAFLQNGKKRRSTGDVILPDRSRVDHQSRLVPESFAGGADVLDILFHRAASERPPAELRCAESGVSRFNSLPVSLLRRIPEKL